MWNVCAPRLRLYTLYTSCKRELGGSHWSPESSLEGRQGQGEDLVHRFVLRAEKIFAGVERTENYSAEVILQQIAVPGVAKAPYYLFKEWTSDGEGLEFTLATVIPSVPPNIVFGPFNFEREPVQMARCQTADTGHKLSRSVSTVQPRTDDYW